MGLRNEGWERALFDTIKAAETRPFVWGEFDCCLFPADAILAMTGEDPATALRGTYSDEAGAMSRLLDFGSDMEASLAAILEDFGLEKVPPLMAQRGDVLLLNMPDTFPDFEAMGSVCIGPDVAILTDKGLKTFPLVSVAKAFNPVCWRV